MTIVPQAWVIGSIMALLDKESKANDRDAVANLAYYLLIVYNALIA